MTGVVLTLVVVAYLVALKYDLWVSWLCGVHRVYRVWAVHRAICTLERHWDWLEEQSYHTLRPTRIREMSSTLNTCTVEFYHTPRVMTPYPASQSYWSISRTDASNCAKPA